MSRLLSSVVCSILVAGVARAQAPDLALQVKVRAEVRSAIEQKLISLLQLDPRTGAALSSVIDRFDDQIAQLQNDAAAAYRELKQWMDGHPADAVGINRLADRMLDDKARIQRLESDRDRALRSTLSPNQYGRLVLAWPTVNRELKREMWKALARQGAAATGIDPNE